MKLRILAAASVVLVPALLWGGEKSATSFHLYYGNAPKELAKLTAGFEPGALAVIETRALKDDVLKKLLADAETSGTRVLGYLSIGEVHADDVDQVQEFLKVHATESATDPATLESITLDRNEIFNSYRVDVRKELYRRWILRRAQEILDLGVEGLFLDTVDTVDVYITRQDWNLKRRSESVAAMIALVRSFKREHPDRYILQNGGLNIIGEQVFIGNDEGILAPAMALRNPHPENPDGILWENAFAGSDAWSKGRLEELRRIQAAGHTQVFALGYEAPFAKPSAFFEKCRENQFVGAWAESSEVLHEAATISAPDDSGAED